MRSLCFFFLLVVQAPLLAGQAQLQADAELFKTKCSACHTLQHALDSQNYLPSQVRQLVTLMASMPNANIRADEQERIAHFLINYNATKNREGLLQALNQLSPEMRAKELKEANQVINGYK